MIATQLIHKAHNITHSKVILLGVTFVTSTSFGAPSSNLDEIQQLVYRKTNIICIYIFFFHVPFPPSTERKLVCIARIICIQYWNHPLLKKGFRTGAPLSDFLVRRFELVTGGNRGPSERTDEDLNHTVVMYWIWRFRVVFFFLLDWTLKWFMQIVHDIRISSRILLFIHKWF